MDLRRPQRVINYRAGSLAGKGGKRERERDLFKQDPPCAMGVDGGVRVGGID